MLPGYERAVRESVPQAVIVFDKFHVVQKLPRAVDTVRKEEAGKLAAQKIDVLAKTRYVFLKNPENLTDKQKARLSDLEKLNLKVNRAYLPKEPFRRLRDCTYRANAEKYLDTWLLWAARSRLGPIRDFAKTVRKHRAGILNYFKIPITNASVEGMNGKARVVSQGAYGHRTFATFQSALHHVLGDLPVPETTHRFV